MYCVSFGISIFDIQYHNRLDCINVCVSKYTYIICPGFRKRRAKRPDLINICVMCMYVCSTLFVSMERLYVCRGGGVGQGANIWRWGREANYKYRYYFSFINLPIRVYLLICKTMVSISFQQQGMSQKRFGWYQISC